MVGGKERSGDTAASTIPAMSWSDSGWPTTICLSNTLLGNIGNYPFRKSVGGGSPRQSPEQMCSVDAIVWQSLSWGEKTYLLITSDREPTVDQITDNRKVQLGLNLLQEAVLFSESCVILCLSVQLVSVFSRREKHKEFLKLLCLAVYLPVYGSPLQGGMFQSGGQLLHNRPPLVLSLAVFPPPLLQWFLSPGGGDYRCRTKAKKWAPMPQ